MQLVSPRFVVSLALWLSTASPSLAQEFKTQTIYGGGTDNFHVPAWTDVSVVTPGVVRVGHLIESPARPRLWRSEGGTSTGPSVILPNVAFLSAGAVDQGFSWISYLDRPNIQTPETRIFVASSITFGVWSEDELPLEDGDHDQASLAVDPFGNPNVAFTWQPTSGTSAPFELRWATSDASGWNEQYIDTVLFFSYTDVGRGVAAAKLADGRRFVAHRSGVHLVLAESPGAYAGWTFETVSTSGGSSPRHISLVIDGTGNPHVAWSSATSSAAGFYYARRIGGQWTQENVGTSGTGCSSKAGAVALGLDAEGNAHVVYGCEGELRYTTNKGGAWTYATVDIVESSQAGFEGFRYPSLDVDAAGGVHIGYQLSPENLYFGFNHVRYAHWLDCNGNGVHDEDDIAAGLLDDCDGDGIPDDCFVAADCNGNGTSDLCEIALGLLSDCDGNGVADQCEVHPDCDGDGLVDPCEADCNKNDVPDDCEALGDCAFPIGQPDACFGWGDCDGNGVVDSCDIVAGMGTDCDGNKVLDACQGFGDCDQNGVPDVCEIVNDGAADCNGNGLLDVCELAQGINDCDGNGILDQCESVIVEQQGPGTHYSYGERIASGDFNDDGIPDIAISAPSEGNGEVYVYYGPVVPPQAPDVTIQGVASDRYGTALAAGDVDGDGVDDLAVGNTEVAPWVDAAGEVLIYRGTAIANGPWATIPAPGTGNQHFGDAIALVDLDNDGQCEVVVGAPQTNGGAGSAYVFLTSPLQTTPHQSWFANPADELFGVSVASAGDVDGNGFNDLLIAAPPFPLFTDPGGPGRVYLWLTQPDLSFTLGASHEGEHDGSEFGLGLNGVGDVNGDGFDDYVVGSPSFTSITDPAVMQIYWEGRAYLYLGGSAPDPWVDLVIDPPSATAAVEASFGDAIAPVGDLSGDGLADYMIGAPTRSQTHLYFGAVDPNAITNQSFVVDDAVLNAGKSLTNVGDMDGDDDPEIAIGAWGTNGVGSLLIAEIPLPRVGDCNANGLNDACDIAQGFSSDVDLDGFPDECLNQAIPYGCGINPDGSLALIGLTKIGGVQTFEVDDPTGTTAIGSVPLVLLSLAPDPAYVCGTQIPGWGIDGPTGELLISFTDLVKPFLIGGPWTGAGPIAIPFGIPDLPNLVGLNVYSQGILGDLGTGKIGLTNALQFDIDA